MDGYIKKRLKSVLAWCISLAIVSIFISCVVYFEQFNGPWSTNQEDWGSFGSYIGGITGPVLSSISLVIIYLTLFSQLDQQNYIQKQTNISSFETSFFNLVNIFHTNELSVTLEVRNAINNDLKNKLKGKFVFQRLYKDFEKRFMSHFELRNSSEECLLKSKEAYEKFYEKYEYILGHYFRALYNIVVFVDSHEGINKVKYLNILMSNMSNSQLVLLMFNVLSSYGSNKFLPLVIKYDLLDNLNDQGSESLKHVWASFKDVNGVD